MPSLTHVMMWSGNTWKPITIDEAVKLFPNQTVPADKGVFICNLCGQPVTLTAGDKYVPYFKHVFSEEGIDCDDRAMEYGSYISEISTHDIPLRLINPNSGDFSFEIGLSKLPTDCLDSQLKITINNSDSDKQYTYLGERLRNDGISFLNVGKDPASKYSIQLSPRNQIVFRYWPEKSAGVFSSGTIFERQSGRKIPLDSDVEVGKPYLFLTRKNVFGVGSHVRVQKLSEGKRKTGKWFVYEIEALDYHVLSVRFFLNIHYRLTQSPVRLTPIWPIFIESPNQVQSAAGELYVLQTGNAELHLYPSTSKKEKYLVGEGSESTLFHIEEKNEQQYISARRQRDLEYIYFWNEGSSDSSRDPRISVVDKSGKKILPGIITNPPEDGLIKITSEFDGQIVFIEEGQVTDVRSLKSEKTIEINNIHFGQTINVYIGLDNCWSLSVPKAFKSSFVSDEDLVRQLMKLDGQSVPFHHLSRAVAIKLKNFPLVRNWLYSQMLKGTINRSALFLLRKAVEGRETYD